MLINKKYRFLFIHIPKNAGTTIRDILKPLGNEEIRGTHIPLYKVPNICNLSDQPGDNRIADFYKFVFVRNPWDRALSLFEFYRTKHARIRFPDKLEFNTWAIDQFDMSNPNRGSILRNSMIKTDPRGKFTEEQFDQCRWIPDDVNYIGRVETLFDDMNNIFDELGIKYDRRTLSKSYREPLNTTEHKPYHEVYNKEARDCVTEYFKRDIERFGYEFLKL